MQIIAGSDARVGIGILITVCAYSLSEHIYVSGIDILIYKVSSTIPSTSHPHLSLTHPHSSVSHFNTLSIV